MKKIFTILLFTILFTPVVMAQVDFTQDEIFNEVKIPKELIVIQEGAVFCKEWETMGAIYAFIQSEDLQQAHSLYMDSLCFSTAEETTVWVLQDDPDNKLIQFRILPPTVVQNSRDSLNWWISKKYTILYTEYLIRIRKELLRLQKGLNKIYNQMETREA